MYVYIATRLHDEESLDRFGPSNVIRCVSGHGHIAALVVEFDEFGSESRPCAAVHFVASFSNCVGQSHVLKKQNNNG